MDYINRILLEKALKEEVFRIDEFENIVRVLVKECGLDDYIKEIVITSLDKYNVSDLTCALYGNQRLYFDYLRTVHSNSIVQKLEGDNRSITYFINLNIIKVIYHELEYVLQERKVLSGINDMESYILLKSYLRRQRLIDEGLYDYFYSLNPIVRQATIRSLEKVDTISRRNNEGPDYFSEELQSIKQSGYNLIDPSLINPFNTFFDIQHELSGIDDLNYDKKIELGLPVKKFIK